MCDIRYFKAAYHNWEVAEKLIAFYESDEAYINDVAYNLQKCVEKTLKAFLECKGVTVPNTHKISRLIQMSKNNGSNAVIPDWITQHCFELETWEAETRYNFDLLLQFQHIQDALHQIKHFLNINGLSYDRLPELTEDKELKLKRLLPAALVIHDTFELNCYYRIFYNKLC